jgi:subtilisin family serine protease
MVNFEFNKTYSYIIIPKTLDEDESVIEKNFKQVQTVLNELGIEDSKSGQKTADSSRGEFTQFNEMKATAVYFSEPEKEKNAREQLENKNDFIPDFTLSIPNLTSKQGKSTTIPEFIWPPDSGIKQEHMDGNKGNGVLIGILDTGIDADHPEFQISQNRNVKFRYFDPIPKSIRPYRDVRGFDIHGHGTKMCGVIAGKNIGIAPEAQLYVGAVIGNGLKSSLSRVFAGLEWLLEEFGKPENEKIPKIINMSIEFNKSDLKSFLTSDLQIRTTLNDLRARIIKLIEKRNILIVAAIGNQGIGSDKIAYPAAFEDVLGVGAVDMNKKIWDSSGGSKELSKPDVVGYGVDISSCVERDYDGKAFYQKDTGTSIASAYVTGVSALYWARDKSLTAQEVREKISIIAAETPDIRFGRGLVVLNPISESIV